MLLGHCTQNERMIGPLEEAKIADLLDPLQPKWIQFRLYNNNQGKVPKTLRKSPSGLSK